MTADGSKYTRAGYPPRSMKPPRPFQSPSPARGPLDTLPAFPGRNSPTYNSLKVTYNRFIIQNHSKMPPTALLGLYPLIERILVVHFHLGVLADLLSR